ncbi:MAG: hypothetical protein OSW77_15270, partial [Proteobacteria bacterium]|nr:hypothetical protein [Pseudomonadota bacterium]
ATQHQRGTHPHENRQQKLCFVQQLSQNSNNMMFLKAIKNNKLKISFYKKIHAATHKNSCTPEPIAA